MNQDQQEASHSCDCDECSKATSLWDYFWTGWLYGYPPCCCARFAWDYSRGRSLVSRGYRFLGVETYVPCGVFHRAHMSRDDWDAVTARIANGANAQCLCFIAQQFPSAFAEMERTVNGDAE